MDSGKHLEKMAKKKNKKQKPQKTTPPPVPSNSSTQSTVKWYYPLIILGFGICAGIVLSTAVKTPIDLKNSKSSL